ncbi:MAG TPA: hypothetical protein VE866_08910 [Candidatus Binatia bacterium]|nr:hypothetical protein [Candidatus Binatia bacterium]
MTLGTIVETIEKALDGLAEDVQVSREPGEILLKVSVGKQLFMVKCSESAPDKDAPAIT